MPWRESRKDFPALDDSLSMQAIGRFRVGRKLGAGGQGTVYLCLDPELQRRVAIKLLNPMALLGEQECLNEARAISRIQHPNIVSIFDVGRERGRPFLVFEYIEGELLSRRLEDSERDIQKILDIFVSMLSGIDQVHQQGIVHHDLKPSNVIIDKDGQPKIMDFGISRMHSSSAAKRGERAGTPRYMAPEYIADGSSDARADIFALGAILYEMLTGRRAFDGAGQQAILNKILQGSVLPPSKLNSEVDLGLDAIVLKALEKEPAARYSDAGEMLTALLEYRATTDSAPSGGAVVSKGTIEFLLRRMQHKRDFPVLSESIRSLNRLTHSEEQDISHLASVIIRDFALTNKILKVVNSAFYSRFAGKVGSISRAIVVLGIKTIRSIAASLIFFEHLHDRTQAARLREDICSAVFSATLAKQVATDSSVADIEGSFLCGMLHNLGRILVTYYLTDESEEVERLMAREKLAPEVAQKRVLGMSFEEVGIAIAKQWNFPDDITRGMARVDPKFPGDLHRTDIKIRLISSFANEAAVAIGRAAPEDTQPCRAVLKRYRMSLAISDTQFDKQVERARDEFRELSGSLIANSNSATQFVRQLFAAAEAKPQVPQGEGEGQLTERCLLLPEEGERVELAPSDLSAARPSPDAELIMTEGLQEVTAMMLDERGTLGQISNVVLETIYRAMAFQHVLLCLHDVKQQRYIARLGFGEDIENFMDGFHFPVHYSATVFHAALKNGVDLYIEESRHANIRESIPQWYWRISSAGSFILLPMSVGRRGIGLIYADHPRARGMTLSVKQLNLMKALRNQILLAVRSRG